MLIYALFRNQIIDEGGRPKIQVEYKAETKTFFAEEVCASSQIWRIKKEQPQSLMSCCLGYKMQAREISGHVTVVRICHLSNYTINQSRGVTRFLQSEMRVRF